MPGIEHVIRSLHDGDAIRLITNPDLLMEVRWRLQLSCGSGVLYAVDGVLRKRENEKSVTSFIEYGHVWDRLPLTRQYMRRRRGMSPIYKTAIYEHVIDVHPLDPARLRMETAPATERNNHV